MIDDLVNALRVCVLNAQKIADSILYEPLSFVRQIGCRVLAHTYHDKLLRQNSTIAIGAGWEFRDDSCVFAGVS